jgi:hypothetical protein
MTERIPAWTLRDISQILMMIEVQSEREIPLFRQIAGDRHHVAGAGIAIGTGRAGKDQGERSSAAVSTTTCMVSRLWILKAGTA